MFRALGFVYLAFGLWSHASGLVAFSSWPLDHGSGPSIRCFRFWDLGSRLLAVGFEFLALGSGVVGIWVIVALDNGSWGSSTVFLVLGPDMLGIGFSTLVIQLSALGIQFSALRCRLMVLGFQLWSWGSGF